MSIDKQIELELSGFYPQGELKALVRLLLYRVAGWSLTDLLTHDDLQLTTEQQTQVIDAIKRLKRHEPIQYILGVAEFCGNDFVVDSHVLIPRPETETLVQLVAESVPTNARLLDIGTGSGCIAISLAQRLPQARVCAYDISAEALQVARCNAQRLGVTVDFRQIDILTPPMIEAQFDAIVSNPPYVMQSEQAAMDKNVLDYEPALALFVPDDKALLFYDKIADFAQSHLTHGGQLFFEINHLLAQQTADLVRSKGYKNVRLICDSFDKERFLIATK